MCDSTATTEPTSRILTIRSDDPHEGSLLVCLRGRLVLAAPVSGYPQLITPSAPLPSPQRCSSRPARPPPQAPFAAVAVEAPPPGAPLPLSKRAPSFAPWRTLRVSAWIVWACPSGERSHGARNARILHGMKGYVQSLKVPLEILQTHAIPFFCLSARTHPGGSSKIPVWKDMNGGTTAKLLCFAACLQEWRRLVARDLRSFDPIGASGFVFTPESEGGCMVEEAVLRPSGTRTMSAVDHDDHWV